MDIEQHFMDLTSQAISKEEDRHFIGSMSLLAHQCFFCGKTFKDPMFKTVVEKWHTQTTSMGGNEETHQVPVTTTTCPYCSAEFGREIGEKTFIEKGWV